MRRLLRPLASLLIGTVIVLLMLIIGLRIYNRDLDDDKRSLEAFRIEYLTPEEAAKLLGEDPKRFARPKMLEAAPQFDVRFSDDAAEDKPDSPR